MKFVTRLIFASFKVMFLFFISTLCLSESASAKSAMFDVEAKSVARSVGVYMNSFTSYSDLLSHLKNYITKEDFVELQNQFQRLHINLNEKIPKLTTRGPVISFEGSDDTVEVRTDMSLRLNGKDYRVMKDKNLSTRLREIIDSYGIKSTFRFPALVETAEAGVKGTAGGFAAFAIAALVANPVIDFIGAGLGLGAGAAAVAPLAVLGIAIWVGKEVYESIEDGNVECKGKYFTVRRKTRGLGVFPTSEMPIVDLDLVKVVLNQPSLTECTKTAAAKLEKAIKDPKLKKQILRPGTSNRSKSTR